jgi:excinuclease ABC subunit C
LPDLVVIDGGKGQLGAAADATRELGLEALPLISLAKREEEIYVVGRTDPIRLPRRSPGLRMLQQARDEAHRFAVTFNRKRRSLRTITSELLSIPGIGPSKRRLLLQTFGSIQGVRDAPVEAIAALPGFSVSSAQRLLNVLSARAEGRSIESVRPAASESDVPPTDAPPPATPNDTVAPEAPMVADASSHPPTSESQ